ncbi:hypothetical protein HDE_12026 [Halotydeus destructor]|nr:hypothetical protein HDE_12026 [Halotydeus destructor]
MDSSWQGHSVQSETPMPPLYPKMSHMYSSSGTLTLSKNNNRRPPPPPVRRSSAISNPDAVTLRTLKSAGVSTYEEIKTLRRTSRSTTHMELCGFEPEPIYSNTDNIYQNQEELCNLRRSSLSQDSERAVSFEKTREAIAEKLKSTGLSIYADIRTLKRNSRSSSVYSSMCTLSRPLKAHPLPIQQQQDVGQQSNQSSRVGLMQAASCPKTESANKGNPLNTSSLSSSYPSYSYSNSKTDYPNETEPLYANSSSDWATNDAAFSEGSVTPTNADSSGSAYGEIGGGACKMLPAHTRSNQYSQLSGTLCSQPSQSFTSKSSPGSPVKLSGQPAPSVPMHRPKLPQLYPKESFIYSSSGTLGQNRKQPPPPPPVRRTSSITNPDAITIGTLRNAGCSSYQEMKTLRRNSRSTTCMDTIGYDPEPIYSNIYQTAEPASQSKTTTAINQEADGVSFEKAKQALAEFLQAKSAFNALLTENSKRDSISDDGTAKRNSIADSVDEPLPPPPPEAYADPATLYPSAAVSTSSSASASQRAHTYNRLSNIHRDFLQTLNAKLAVPHEQRMSPRLIKRRSMSVGEHDWDSDSGIATGSTCSATSSISSHQSQQHSLRFSLMRLMGHGISSSRLASATSGPARKPKSPEAARKTYMYISDI